MIPKIIDPNKLNGIRVGDIIGSRAVSDCFWTVTNYNEFTGEYEFELTHCFAEGFQHLLGTIHESRDTDKIFVVNRAPQQITC